MRLLTVVALKELIDNFRDKRAVLSALVFGPLFGPVLFGVLVSFAVDKAVSEVDEKIAPCFCSVRWMVSALVMFPLWAIARPPSESSAKKGWTLRRPAPPVVA